MELGLGSMLAVQLYVQGTDPGALNVLSEEVDAFGEESEHEALLFASYAAIAMIGAQQQEQLRSTIEFPRSDRAGQGHPEGAAQHHR